MKNSYLSRQFVFSDRADTPFDGWITCSTVSSYLHHHLDLPVSQLRSKDAALTLVGYWIDPDRPELQDAALLRDLFASLADKNDVVGRAQRFAGRWVLFVETPGYTIALHDACGLRRLFYSEKSCGAHFCASEASTAAKIWPIEKDYEAIEGFLKTPFAQQNPEYWWPGDATQFKGVRVLLPNHYLDLETWNAVRFSPNERVGELSLRASAEQGAAYLANLVRGGGLRFELALALTAGWDSRTILAACRSVSVKPHCYTLRFRTMSERSQDIAVPARLLAKMHWTHHVIDCARQPSQEFVSMYKSSVDPAHNEACQLAFGLWNEFPRQRVTLSGHCSEIARSGYYLSSGTELSVEDLARLTGMNPTSYVLDQFDRWLQGAREARRASGIGLPDLFYWEQRVGRWAANGQNQWDIVHERFTPFNCRPLLFTLLASPERGRVEPDYRLYRRMIENLSASVLSEPVNPDSTPVTAHDPGLFNRVLTMSAKYLLGTHPSVQRPV